MSRGTEGKRRPRRRKKATPEQPCTACAEPEVAQRFDELYRAWKPLVHAAARNLLDSDHDAEDARRSCSIDFGRAADGAASVHLTTIFFRRLDALRAISSDVTAERSL